MFRELAEHGFIGKACAAAGYKRTTVTEWRRDNPEFAEQFDDALAAHVESLEAEADRRGKNGIDKPVFYRGVQVATVKEFSDTLLLARLKALAPDKYRERTEHSVAPGSGFAGVVFVTPDGGNDASKG